jgi:hypothetical protein
MPNGFTTALYEGDQSAQDFAIGCLKAFGAYYSLCGRDEQAGPKVPWDSLPEKRLTASVERLAALENRTEAEWVEAFETAVLSHEARQHCDNILITARQERFKTVITAIEKANFSENVEDFKQFMLEQLATENLTPFKIQEFPDNSVEEFRRVTIHFAQKQVDYYTKNLEEYRITHAAKQKWADEAWAVINTLA